MICKDQIVSVEVRCRYIASDPIRACLQQRFGVKLDGRWCFYVGIVDADGCWACLWDGFSYDAAILESEMMSTDWEIPVLDRVTEPEFGAGPS